MTTTTHEQFNHGTNSKPRRSMAWLAGLSILVLLGLGVSITFSGPEASVGQSVLNGVRMVVEEQNAEGGISGRQVELLVKDDDGEPELGIRSDLAFGRV